MSSSRRLRVLRAAGAVAAAVALTLTLGGTAAEASTLSSGNVSQPPVVTQTVPPAGWKTGPTGPQAGVVTPMHQALLGFCPSSTAFRLHLSAYRNLGSSSNWTDMGFRSCNWPSADSHYTARTTIAIRCSGGNGYRPNLHIVNDSMGGDEEGSRSILSIPKDNVWYYIPSNNGWPTGTNAHTYHIHLRQYNIDIWGHDATYGVCEIQVGM